ncbi:hypothetical protein [Lactococcus garvieae]|uniref:hypothetical protein n=1 Tax=Lactococcus garvieae TaxID=1363 RepID=UPI0009BEC807|nr:hypothetical protein [Lactococcus garvieae]
MKKKPKKVVIYTVVGLLLLSSTAPSVAVASQAREINRNQEISDTSNEEESNTFAASDLIFLQQKEQELLMMQNRLVVPRAFSIKRVGKNLQGLWHRSANIRNALRAVGLGWSQINAMVRGVYIYGYGTIAAKIATVAAWNWAIGAVIGVSAAGAMYAMGNYRLFY